MLVSQGRQQLQKRTSAPIAAKFCQYAVQKGVLEFWYDCAAYAVEEIDGSWFCRSHAKTVKGIK